MPWEEVLAVHSTVKNPLYLQAGRKAGMPASKCRDMITTKFVKQSIYILKECLYSLIPGTISHQRTHNAIYLID